MVDQKQLLKQDSPKICVTVAGVLIHENKVLLVKHKKLQIWLNPGGHIEENEAPHKAAEREFFEETGVQVRAVRTQQLPDVLEEESEFLPNPILTNLHWVSRENYQARVADPEKYQTAKNWQRGCEQHLNFMYLVEPVGETNFKQNEEECDGINWFTREEALKLETLENIRIEIEAAFQLVANTKNNGNMI